MLYNSVLCEYFTKLNIKNSETKLTKVTLIDFS